jgi:hypothetical protein
MRYWFMAIAVVLMAFGFALMGLLKPDLSRGVRPGRVGYTTFSGEYRPLGIVLFSGGLILLVAGVTRKQ